MIVCWRISSHSSSVERAGLVEDGVWNGDLSNVVQLCGAGELVERFPFEAHPSSNGKGVRGDPVHMATECRFALSQHLHQHVVGLASHPAAAGIGAGWRTLDSPARDAHALSRRRG